MIFTFIYALLLGFSAVFLAILPQSEGLSQTMVDSMSSMLALLPFLNTFFPLDTMVTIATVSMPIIAIMITYRVTVFAMKIISLIRRSLLI